MNKKKCSKSIQYPCLHGEKNQPLLSDEILSSATPCEGYIHQNRGDLRGYGDGEGSAPVILSSVNNCMIFRVSFLVMAAVSAIAVSQDKENSSVNHSGTASMATQILNPCLYTFKDLVFLIFLFGSRERWIKTARDRRGRKAYR